MKQISKKYSSGFSIIILITGAVVIGTIVALAIFGYNSITKKTSSTEQTNQTNTADTANTTAAQAGQEWVTVGTQKWAKTNLNVGTMITGNKDQTDNSILEKYCYDNLESNCTTYGGLYQWNEAMQYVSNEGAQGICPDGSHIPTDNEWKVLEMQLGMTKYEADTTYDRGIDQGTQLKSGGASGLNILLAGYRFTNGSFGNLSVIANLWSSSESGTKAWERGVVSAYATVARYLSNKESGFLIRCVQN